MTDPSDIIALCALAVSVIATITATSVAVYSIWQSRRFFMLQPKRDVLRRYMAHVDMITGNNAGKGFSHLKGKEPFIALNEARAVFADNEKIIDLLQELPDSKNQSDILVKLMRAMGEAAGFDLSKWPDEFLLSPFTPKE